MKTFRRILSEVAQPKPADEINFKAKHAIEFFDYPSDVEDQFKSKKGKAPKRVADYDKDEDEAVYETTDPVGQEDDDIDNDGDSDKSDKYLLNRRKAIKKSMKKEEVKLDEVARSGIKKSEQYTDVNGRTRTRLVSVKRVDHNQHGQDKIKEEVELDEISKSTLGRYVKAASTDRASKTSEKDSVDRDYPKHSFADRLTYKKELGSKINKRRVGISNAVDRLTKEEVELDEAFAAGAEKLKDGSTVILKKQDADMLNNMFKDLNPANRKKMLKVAMTDKVGFNEILGFAREAL